MKKVSGSSSSEEESKTELLHQSIPTIYKEFKNPLLDIPTGIVVTIREQCDTKKVVLAELTLLYNSNNGPTTYSRTINCRKYTNYLLNGLDTDCGEGEKYLFCDGENHQVDESNVIHNEVILGERGIRKVQVIVPNEARDFVLQENRTPSTFSEVESSSSQSSTSSQMPTYIDNDLVSLSSAVSTVLYPAIIDIVVKEDMQDTTHDVFFDMLPPLLMCTAKQPIFFSLPPFVVNYVCIKEREKGYIIQKAFLNTSPETFELDQTSNITQFQNTIKSVFTIKVIYCSYNSTGRNSFSTASQSFNEHLCSYITYSPINYVKPDLIEPETKKWTMKYENLVRTKVKTDYKGIRRVHVSYLTTQKEKYGEMMHTLQNSMVTDMNRMEE